MDPMNLRRSQTETKPSSPTQRNIKAISQLEDEALKERSWGQRLGDQVTRVAGQMWFICLHAVWFAGWAFANFGLVPGLRPFDPFPYPFLTFVVSLEAIFLSLFILMSQNRANQQADKRSHLDLQINLLAEIEMTKVLQMLQALCAFHHLTEAEDPALPELQSETDPDQMLKQIKENMPTE
jgi:uncharacterized membrane protein